METSPNYQVHMLFKLEELPETRALEPEPEHGKPQSCIFEGAEPELKLCLEFKRSRSQLFDGWLWLHFEILSLLKKFFAGKKFLKSYENQKSC